MIASIPRLRKMVIEGEVSEAAQRVASDILAGENFDVGGPHLDAIAMQALLSAGKLTCLVRSDTHDIARTVLSEMDITLCDSHVVDLDPDEGLEKSWMGTYSFMWAGHCKLITE